MPIDKVTGRYIPEDETDEQVQAIIESRPDLIWEAEQDPDEDSYWLVTEEIGVLDTVGLFTEEIEERANRIVSRHNKAVRKAIRAAIEATRGEPCSGAPGPEPEQETDPAPEEPDWIKDRPVVSVLVDDLIFLSEVITWFWAKKIERITTV